MVRYLRQFWFRSLTRQLLLGMVLVQAICMTGFVMTRIMDQRLFLRQQGLHQIQALTRNLAVISVTPMLSQNVMELYEIIQSIMDYPEFRHAMILTSDGRVLAHSQMDHIGQYAQDSQIRAILSAEAVSHILSDNDDVVDVLEPIRVKGRLIGWARISLGQEHIKAGLWRIVKRGTFAGVLAMLIGAGIAWWMARFQVRGLRHLMRVTDAATKGEAGQRATLGRPDEIGRLGQDINRMLDTLEIRQKKILHANRLYATLSQINQAIVHAPDTKALFTEICRVAVDHGQFRLAWIGDVMPDNPVVIPRAYSGVNQGYLDGFQIDLTDPLQQNGPSARAILTGNPAICNDIQNDPRMTIWKERAKERGYRSSAAIPIIQKGQTTHIFNLYATEPDFFDDAEMRLLTEIAGDISFALDVFQKEAQRAEATRELLRHREHLTELVRERTRDLEESNERLLEIDRLKSVFLASMSHELRTPLNSIIGFTGIILQGLTGEINAEQHKQLSIVKNSARHLLNLINDVLDISKIEAGRADISLRSFPLQAVIREVMEIMGGQASARGLDLLLDVPSEITLYSDQRRLCQILLNLMSNAIKFTEHGYIRLTAKLETPDRLQLSVADTGIGIRPENMGRLFMPFQQVEMTLTKRYEGTGLGLHLCRKLAEMLHGKIEVISHFGKGSTFVVTIPLRYQEIQDEKNSGD